MHTAQSEQLESTQLTAVHLRPQRSKWVPSYKAALLPESYKAALLPEAGTGTRMLIPERN